jgi:hypothetical protein
MRKGFNGDDYLDDLAEHLRHYLKESGWAFTGEYTSGPGFEVWIDGNSLHRCTSMAALREQMRRDGFYGIPEKGWVRFGTGIEGAPKVSREEYDTLVRLSDGRQSRSGEA